MFDLRQIQMGGGYNFWNVTACKSKHRGEQQGHRSSSRDQMGFDPLWILYPSQQTKESKEKQLLNQIPDGVSLQFEVVDCLHEKQINILVCGRTQEWVSVA